MIAARPALPVIGFLVLLVSVLLAPEAAHATAYATTGERCTKVGTPRSDRITGTSRRDVICGRGGNDVIAGGGGNDLIDAGTGNDVVRGGAGQDRLLGGAGSDSLYGDDGSDVVDGQQDGDSLVGGTGNDSLSGSAGGDRIDGGIGNDTVNGGEGGDVLDGSAGSDRLAGADDDDTIRGAAGDDVLVGGNGDDDLLGGDGTDDFNGGAGTNWCDASGLDTQSACKTDLESPQATDLTLSRTTVDVSDAQALVQVSVHVTDDTGVRQVQIGYAAHLTRGTPRDGWWSTTFRVPRYADPGVRSFDVFVTDRIGRSGGRTFHDVLTVVDRNPDRSPPEVRAMTISPQSVDVRSSSRTVSATVRITDDLAGVGSAWLCPSHLFADAYRQADACQPLEQVSGNAKDGQWKGSYRVPRGAVGGPWNFQVWLYDAADKHETQYYVGPDQVQWEAAHDVTSYDKPLPGGAGRFNVTGTSDNTAPELVSMTLRPSHVDVKSTSAVVTIDVATRDAEGVTGIGIAVGADGEGGWINVGQSEDATLVQGTRRDGMWRLHIDVAQGTPAGPYWIQLWIVDATHFATWFAPEYSPGDSSLRRLTPEQAPSGTTVVVD